VCTAWRSGPLRTTSPLRTMQSTRRSFSHRHVAASFSTPAPTFFAGETPATRRRWEDASILASFLANGQRQGQL